MEAFWGEGGEASALAAIERWGNEKLDIDLINELVNSGVKCNVNDIVGITKTVDGKLVWLENGNSRAGLEHIMQQKEYFNEK